MPVITINGQIGSAVEVGEEVARRLSADYVDRQVLAEAGRRMGTTEAALSVQEGKARTFMERLRGSVERSINRVAAVPASPDEMSSGGWASFMALPYPEENRAMETGTLISDDLYLQVVHSVVHDVAASGNVVIVGRASNLVLKDRHPVLHVRTVAPLLFRVEAIMKREGLAQAEAAQFVRDQERARVAHYQRSFKVDEHDALLYDLVVNLGTLGMGQASRIIAHAAALKG